MASLAKILPASVRGGIPARQARSIWFELAQQLETAMLFNQSLQGICLDICKCFNALPREPLWTALHALGFPYNILRPWASFLAQNQRRFKVRSSTGRAVFSNVGFPEGCALSVFSMAVLDWIVSLWIESKTPGPTTFLSYVDDWQVLFEKVEHFGSVWGSIQGAVNSLDLQLDEEKSFAWAALSKDRAHLASCPVACKLAARDLGAHQNYCKRAGNRTLVDRVKAMHQVWRLLRTCHSPFKLKCTALLQLAWPRALHGISIVKLGSSHYDSLRTGAARGLRFSQVGSNPMLLLASVGSLHDPEAWAILQTFRDARTIGSIATMLSVLTALVNFPEQVPANGPATIIAERVARLGWSFNSEGLVLSDLGQFDIFHDSWASIHMRFCLAWPRVIATEVVHRKSFSGIQFADLPALWESLKRFGEIDLVFLRSALSGTLYTDIGKDKSNRGSHSKCQHCGAVDSFRRRNWFCPAFASCRASFRWTSLLDSLPDCLVCHGWPTVPKAWLDLLELFEAIPDRQGVIACPASPLPPVVDLFVDGACACPKNRRLRFASWAVTMALSDFTSLDHQVVAAGHLRGMVQSSYRAELTAMLTALRHACRLGGRVRIWSDNDAVVQVTKKALRERVRVDNGSHSDLIQQLIHIGQLLQGRDIHIVKVVSHCSAALTADPVETWAFWHNSLVDELAGKVNFRRPDSFWTTWSKAAAAIQFQSELLFEVQSVLLKVGRLAKHLRKDVETPTQEQPEFECLEAERPRPARRWAVCNKLEKKYLPLNIEWVHRWWCEVGLRLVKQSGPLLWVSGIQLYCDFRMFSQFDGLLSPRHGVWYDSEATSDGRTKVGIASRTTMFLNVLGAYWKSHAFKVSRKLNRPHSGTIACWTLTYLLPWSIDRLQVIDQVIFDSMGRQIMVPKELDAIENVSGILPQ